MTHDVFISYAMEDRPVADAVCQALEERGVRCWYAPRDIPYAVDYEEAIVDAISQSKLLLLILSAHANDSAHVKREVQNACREEPPIPVLPFQIENVPLSKSFRYYIGSVHWLSALTPPLEDHLQKLVQYVRARLPQHELDGAPAAQSGQPTQAEIVGKDEEEALGHAEEALRLAEEAKRREVEEEERLAAEAEAQRKAEEERERREAEETQRAEEAQKRRRLAAEEAARLVAEERRREEEEKRQREAAEIKQRREDEERQEKERQAEERCASETRFHELNLAATQRGLEEFQAEFTAADAPAHKNKRVILIALGTLIAAAIIAAVTLTGRKQGGQQQTANQNATPTSTRQGGQTIVTPPTIELTPPPSPTPEPKPTPDKAALQKDLDARIKKYLGGAEFF